MRSQQNFVKNGVNLPVSLHSKSGGWVNEMMIIVGE